MNRRTEFAAALVALPIRGLLALTTVCSLLVGCVHFQGSSASIDRECPPRGLEGVERIHLRVVKASGELLFAHGMLANEVESFDFVIPFMPAGRTSFNSQDVVLREAPRQTEIPADGTIVVDPKKREIVVALRTAGGDFRGNGTYSIEFDLPPPSPGGKQASCTRPPVAMRGWPTTESVDLESQEDAA